MFSRIPLFCILTALLSVIAYAGAVRPGFNATSMPRNDDDSTVQVPIGFQVIFSGTSYNSLYVNNNGNITFDAPLNAFTPVPFGNAGRKILAPFWADVDTWGTLSGVTKYGTGTVNGRDAFGVSWVNVGYFLAHDDKLNSFQLIIIDRSDRAPGAIDVEFNYDSILWETGDASGGSGGLGGSSVRAGFSDGTVNDFEILGSGINGGFLNSNTTTGLIHHSRNSSVLGR